VAVEELIRAAREAGLRLAVERDELVVRGPRSLAEMAEQSIARKVDVLAALQVDCGPAACTPVADCSEVFDAVDGMSWANGADPLGLPEPCMRCGSLELWWNFLEIAFCQHCQPPHPRGSEVLRLATKLRQQGLDT
jgi:hypothetical protein